KQDVPLAVSPQQLQITEKNSAELIKWFKELEFKSWLAELLNTPSVEKTTAELPEKKSADYQIILTEEDFNQWLIRLQKADEFAFDTETTDLNYVAAELVGVSFAVHPGEAAYVPAAHDYPEAPEQLARDWVLDKLRPL